MRLRAEDIMKTQRLLLAFALVLVFGAIPLVAQVTAPHNDMNDLPGATLLMPYFQVDRQNTSGWTTVMSVNNASATAILGHVTIWSDLSVPVFAFDIYLTGYDSQAIDIRAVINGTLPRTASA